MMSRAELGRENRRERLNLARDAIAGRPLEL